MSTRIKTTAAFRAASAAFRAAWAARPAATAAVLAAIALLGLWSPAGANEIRESLFRPADTALEEAKGQRADLLAPVSYERAMDYYGRASEGFSRGKDLERIQKDLQEAERYLAQARTASEAARQAFPDVLVARQAAMDARSPKLTSKVWQEAEDRLREAAKDLERGRGSSAARQVPDMMAAYRTAEVEALKAQHIGSARTRLRQADLMDAETHAPRTLKRARDLVDLVEIKLAEPDYDPEEVRRLSDLADRAARRAVYLTSRVQRVKLGRETLEEAFLTWEDQMDRLSEALRLEPAAENKKEGLVDRMIEKIEDQRARIETLSQSLAFQEEQVQNLKRGIGGLEERLDQETRSRKLLAALESMFEEGEATVLRSGEDVIIRLSGLNFRVGRSSIEPEHYALLGKLQDAIRMFPASQVTIEGHTDAYGTDQENLRLSSARAQAVREYLAANLAVAPEAIQATGLGESRPIASNETPEGRSRNRRIDVVFSPASEGLLGILR